MVHARGSYDELASGSDEFRHLARSLVEETG
jgi:hypothetical protein